MSDAINSFTEKCAVAIVPNEEQIRKHLNNSLMLAAALNPIIGYDKAAMVAKLAHQNHVTLKEAVLQLGFMNEQNFDALLDPSNMTRPAK